MRSLPLHIKTTLLASAVILLVMAITLGVFSSRILSRLQNQQRQFAQLQAENLAEQISSLPAPRDYEQIARLVALLIDKKQKTDSSKEIRIWERSGNVFVKRIIGEKENASGTEGFSEKVKFALRGAQEIQVLQENSDGDVYRVYVPIFEPTFAPIFDQQNRVSGAVEVAQKLDTSWQLVWRFLLGELWLAAGSVLLLSLSIYFLFRWFVYRPLDKLALAMGRAKRGELTARAELNSNDEIGELGREFNRMLAQIGEMTREREIQKDVLQQEVQSATVELKSKNSALEQASRELWHTSRKISELERLAAAGTTAAQFAHEVGTPLNLISGHVQLLKMQSDGNIAAENRLQIITAQIERIERIVRQMLDRTRFGETEFESIELNAVLSRIIAVTAPTLEEKNVRLETELDNGLPNIMGNTDRLQQVFINLINNALDAMPSGGELKIKTEVNNNKICVGIADNGIGMNEETQMRIFEPLYTTKQRGHGTGLGLVVVRQILQEHNAEISVTSEAGKGTSFVLSFPLNHDEKDFSSR
ncbi:MAG: ATP-binding protein [Pyrinomonadaceae bacterium]